MYYFWKKKKDPQWHGFQGGKSFRFCTHIRFLSRFISCDSKCSTTHTIIPLGLLLAVAYSEKKRLQLRKSLGVGFVDCFRHGDTPRGAWAVPGLGIISPGISPDNCRDELGKTCMPSSKPSSRITQRKASALDKVWQHRYSCHWAVLSDNSFPPNVGVPWGIGIALVSSSLPTATPFTRWLGSSSRCRMGQTSTWLEFTLLLEFAMDVNACDRSRAFESGCAPLLAPPRLTAVLRSGRSYLAWREDTGGAIFSADSQTTAGRMSHVNGRPKNRPAECNLNDQCTASWAKYLHFILSSWDKGGLLHRLMVVLENRSFPKRGLLQLTIPWSHPTTTEKRERVLFAMACGHAINPFLVKLINRSYYTLVIY